MYVDFEFFYSGGKEHENGLEIIIEKSFNNVIDCVKQIIERYCVLK